MAELRRLVHLLVIAAAFLVAWRAGSAVACPRCDTAVAAREIAWSDQPGRWALVTAAPFLTIAALAFVTHRIGRPSPETRKSP